MGNSRLEKLSREDKERFAEQVAAFEADWGRFLREGGPPPRISDFLPTEEPLRSALAAELAVIDLERRLKAGKGVRVEHYLKQLPQLGKDRAAVLSLIQAEYEFRRLNEPALQAAEYARRFPALASQVQERLAADAAGGKVTGRPRPAQETVTDPLRTTPHQPAPGSLAGAETPTHWYYTKDNKNRIGPFSWEELRQAAAQGHLTRSDIVYQEGTSKWQPAGLVPGLFPAEPATPDGSGTERTGPFPEVPGYEILGELGRGGMGVVYKARQLNLNRPVAVKMIRMGAGADPEELARFRAEAEALARLQNPNIVQIHEVGEQDGQPFFSLELVEGGSLAQKLAGAPLLPGQAARLVQTLAVAVHAAHQRGIIHRDLKPANVLLTADCTPKITDFGLAKRLDDDSGQTRTGAIMGTPSYMAPEQARGDTAAIGPTTDVYALGAIIYEMLTGRPPFRAATVVDTLDQVRSQEPVPPRRTNNKIPRDLETICLKCLHKEPHCRYATAAQLAEDLRRFLGGEPIVARPVRSLERAVKWAKRRPAVAALLAVVALLTLAGVGGISLAYREALRERDNAQLEKDNALTQEGIARTAESKAREAEGLAKKAEADAKKAEADAKAKAEESQRLLANSLVLLAQAAWRENDVVLAHAHLNQVPSALRRWEWNYLKRLYQGGLFTLYGHTGSVSNVAFSPDGQRLASISFDSASSVRVWDATSGRVLLALRESRWGGFSGVAFSPDGQRLALGCADKMVRLLDASSGRELLVLKGHTNGVRNLAFSPDGRRLASVGGGDAQRKPLPGEMRLWDTESGQELLALKGHTQPAGCVAFSPDGQRLASGSSDQTVRLWDTGNGRELLVLQGHTDEVTGVAFSPDGQRLASASYDRTVRLWDASSGRELLVLQGHTIGVSGVAFSPDGQRLAASGDETVRVWDARNGQELLILKGHVGWVRSVAFSSDGQRLASGSDDRTVKVWDARGSREPLAPKGHTRDTVVAVSPDGYRVASVSSEGMVQLWDTASSRLLMTLKGHTHRVTSVAFSPIGQRLASTSWDHTVRLWDAGSGRELLVLKGHTAMVTSVAFSPDGQRLASGSGDGTVRLWDAGSGRELRVLQGHTGGVAGVAFSSDGLRLASHGKAIQFQKGQQESFIEFRLWDVGSGREVAHKRGVQLLPGPWVIFSPDGQRLAWPGHGGVWLWDAGSGRDPVKLRGRDYERTVCLTFSPDGRRLASCGEGLPGASFTDNKYLPGEARVWDTESGQELLVLKGHSGEVTSMAFSPDGHRLASGSSDRTVRLWDTMTGHELLVLNGSTYGKVTGLAFSTDGHRLASWAEGGYDAQGKKLPGEMRLWDTPSCQQLLVLRGYDQPVWSMAFSPDGQRLASGSSDKTVRLWDTGNGRELRVFKGHSQGVTSVAFSPDGRRLASGSYDGTLRLWDATSGQELLVLGQDLLVLRHSTDRVTGLVFSPDGQRLAWGSGDGTVRLCAAENGMELLVLRGHGTSVHGLAFSPDGRRLAAGSYDGAVRLWDVGSGRELLALEGNAGPVLSVAFSPDGRRLASSGGGNDAKSSWWPGAVRLWDAENGQLLLVLKGHPDIGVESVAFSHDGERVIGGLGAESALVWNSHTGQLIPGAPDRIGTKWRPISRDGKLLASGYLENVICLIDPRPPDADELTYRQRVTRLDASWHVAEADRHQRAGEGFATAFHLEQLLTEGPAEGALLESLSQSWPLLAQHCPGQVVTWRRLALSQLRADRVDAYRQTCVQMQHRLAVREATVLAVLGLGSNSTDALGAAAMAWLSAQPPTLPAVTLTLRTSVLESKALPEPLAWLPLLPADEVPLRGAVLYRAGRYAEAVEVRASALQVIAR